MAVVLETTAGIATIDLYTDERPKGMLCFQNYEICYIRSICCIDTKN